VVRKDAWNDFIFFELIKARFMAYNVIHLGEEIKKEIKICIEKNKNENTATQNLWDTVKGESS